MVYKFLIMKKRLLIDTNVFVDQLIVYHPNHHIRLQHKQQKPLFDVFFQDFQILLILEEFFL